MGQSYFVRSHTALGEKNLLKNQLTALEQIIYLQGSIEEIHTILLKVLEKLSDCKVDQFLFPNEPSLIEGLIIYDKKTVICAHYLYEKSNLKEKWIKLSENKSNYSLNNLYPTLREALTYHDSIEKIYYQFIDFKRAETVKNKLIQQIENYAIINETSLKGYVSRFFGSFHTKGSTHLAENLMKDIKYIYHIKGEAGNGKSYLMKSVVQYFEAKELYAYLYYCNFDPESIDMVIIPALNVCLLDSTPPHSYTAEGNDEYIVDMFDLTIKKERVKQEEEIILEYEKMYHTKIKEARMFIEEEYFSIKDIQIKNEADTLRLIIQQLEGIV